LNSLFERKSNKKMPRT